MTGVIGGLVAGLAVLLFFVSIDDQKRRLREMFREEDE